MKNYTNERDLDIEFRHQPDFVREKAIFEREKELPAHLRTDFKGRSEDDDD